MEMPIDFPTLADAKPISLYDYQESAVDMLRRRAAQGARRLILAAPTGSGKTEVGAYLITLNQLKQSTAWFIVDRVTLVNQTSERFFGYGIDHGIIQGDNRLTDYAKPVQIVSAQTLARRNIRKLPDLIIVDEAHCFPAGTMIETPDGAKPIEQMRIGDAVYSAIGVGRVLHLFRNDSNKIVKVTFDDGTEIICTDNHRFFTEDAWIEARFMDGQSAIGIESMSELWERLSSADSSDSKGELAGRIRGQLAKADMLLAKLCEEIKEPDGQSPEQGEDGQHVVVHGASTEDTWGEWAGPYRSTAEAIAETWRRLDSGICGPYQGTERRGIPDALQDRFGEPRPENRDRTGRQEPCRVLGETKRQQEGSLPFRKRVVSVEAVQCDSAETVFNIHVSGHPSYFANGVLVHNCEYESVLRLIEEADHARVIGLTATPFTAGMADHWDGIVNVTTVNKLLAQGRLSPLKIKACVSPDMKDAKKKFNGEYEEEDAGQRGIQIVGDVVHTWVQQTNAFFGGPVKTIVFSPSVAHGAELCRQFAEAGFNFQQISYLDKSDTERDDKIKEFRKPDSAIHGLVSCAVLTKGFDVPDVMCGISCRPYAKSFSSHIQEMGRVMRTFPGKDFGLWLCHSGNCIAFAADTANLYEYGVDSLSDAQKKDSEAREPNEKAKNKYFCGECGMQMEPSADACPSCGWQRPRGSTIEIVQGELIDFDMSAEAIFKPRKGLRADCLRDYRGIWHAAVAYCMSHTRKGEETARKWAYRIWNDIYPDNRLPYGLYERKIVPKDVTSEQWSMIDREVQRSFRNRRKAA